MGGTFRCDTATLLRLATGKAGPDTIVAVSGEQTDLWSAIRGQSGIEVQGVMTTADALRVSNGDTATLCRIPGMLDSSQSFTSVRVPLSRLARGQSPQSEENYLNIDPISVHAR